MTKSLASRGALSFAGAVFAGCISAAIFVTALNHVGTLLSFIFYLTAIPVFIAGLGVGAIAGLAASTSGLIGIYLAGPTEYKFAFLVLYTVVCAIPAALLVALALRHRMGTDQKVHWYPEGRLLMALVVYPCIIFLFVTLDVMDHPGGLLGITNEYIQAATQAAKTHAESDLAAQMASPEWMFFLKFLPAITGIAWALTTGVSLVIAQGALQQHGKNLRTKNFVMRDLYLPEWPIVALATAGLVGVIAPAPFDYTGANIAVMLGLPYLLVGLAVIHAWAETQKHGKAFLVFFYVILFYFVGLMVVLLGVVDQWANFRKHINKQPKIN